MFFRSLPIFAALACATLSSAVPLGASDLTGVAGVAAVPAVPNVGAVPELKIPNTRRASPADDLAAGALKKANGVVPTPTQVGDSPADFLPREDEHPTLPEIFGEVCQKLRPINEKLKKAIAIKTEIKLETVVSLLEEIIVVLTVAVAKVQFIANNPSDFVLGLAGSILSIPQLAFVIATLFEVVFGVLALVIGTVDAATKEAILPLLSTIDNLVAHILGLTFTIVPGLLAALIPVIHTLLRTVYYLNLAQVVAILGLPAHY